MVGGPDARWERRLTSSRGGRPRARPPDPTQRSQMPARRGETTLQNHRIGFEGLGFMVTRSTRCARARTC